MSILLVNISEYYCHNASASESLKSTIPAGELNLEQEGGNIDSLP
jgi:hypothetical protein